MSTQRPSTQQPTPDLIEFGSALEFIIIHTIDTHSHNEVCALQCYNHRVIFSIARIILDERCCQPLWPSTGTLFNVHSMNVGGCTVWQSMCWCIKCAVCLCVGHRSAERARTHTQDEHVRNRKTLLPALPMSALASRWTARQNVYSNVANDVDWLANTSRYDCFILVVVVSFTLLTMCNSNAFDYCCCCHSVEWTRRRPLCGNAAVFIAHIYVNDFLFRFFHFHFIAVGAHVHPAVWGIFYLFWFSKRRKKRKKQQSRYKIAQRIEKIIFAAALFDCLPHTLKHSLLWFAGQWRMRTMPDVVAYSRFFAFISFFVRNSVLFLISLFSCTKLTTSHNNWDLFIFIFCILC